MMEPRSSGLIILIVICPLAAAALMQLIGRLNRRLCMPLALAACLASTTLTAILAPSAARGLPRVYLPGNWGSIGIELKMDLLALLFCLLIGGLASLALTYSYRFIPHELAGREVSYYTVFLFLVSGLLGLAIAGDLLTFWIFMEVMALSAYVLIAIINVPHAFESSLRYLFMGTLSSLAILAGIVLLFGATGSLNMRVVLDAIRGGADGQVTLALALCAVGFCVKGAQVPVHFWLPGAHSAAVTPISAMHSGLVAKVGFYGLARFIFFVFGTVASVGVLKMTSVLQWIGALSILYGGLMAILEDDLKRMLAYSTISHIGFMVLGISLLSPGGLTGAFYHLLDDGLAKACLFLCAGIFIYRDGTRSIKQLKGIALRTPITAAVFTLAAFSLVGIPPTSGFVAKWYLVLGSLEAHRPFFAAVMIIGAILAAVYAFRVVFYMFFAPERSGALQVDDVPAGMLAPVVILGVGTWVLGVAAIWILPYIQRFVATLVG